VTAYRLGINTCFAVKRWAEPERWVRQAVISELRESCDCWRSSLAAHARD
jgi:hypothetical protein